MAESTVTGQIGDQEVNLRNAASEATLQKLLDAMLRQGGSGGTDKLQKLSTDAKAANTKTVTENKTAFVKNTESVNKSAKAISDFGKGMLSAAGSVLTRTYATIKGLSNELVFGGDRVSDFTRHLTQLPLGLGQLGGVVDAVASAIDESMTTWRTLSEAGAAFNNSIAEMRHSAAQAGMSIAEFGSFVSANSKTLGMFGTSTTDGVRNFAKLSKEMRRPGGVGAELMSMGYSLQDLNEVLLGYAEQEARMGRTRNLNDLNVIDSAGAFAKELDLAAKISGVSRKALLESSKAMSKDAGMRSLLAGLSKEDAAVAKANLTMVSNMLPELASGFMDIADGIPQSDLGKALQVFSAGELTRLTELAAKGKISQVDYYNALIESGKDMAKRAEAMSKEQIDAMRVKMPALGTLIDSLGDLAGRTRKSADQMEKEAKSRDSLTSFFATFELFTKAFRTGLIDIIYSSKTFGKIKAAFDEIAGTGSGALPTTLTRMLGLFQRVVTWIDGFITDVEASSFSQVFRTRMSDLADDLKIYATEFLKGLFNIDERELHKNRGGEEGKSLPGAIMQRIVDTMSPYVKQLGTVLVDGATAALKSMGQKMLDELVNFWNNNKLVTLVAAGFVGLFAAKKIAGLLGGGAAAGGAAATVANAGTALRGIAAGVSAFANPLALIGLTALVVAINGVALAARVAAPIFEPLGKMIKATLDGLAPLVTSVFGGVNTFIATIGGTILGVINGVTNGIAKLTDKTATINATTDQLERLSKIPSGNLIGAAAGIEKMKAALEGFTPGFFSGLSQAIGSFFAGDQATNISRLAEAASRLNNATTNLNIGKSFALPEGIEGRYKSFAEQMYNLAPSISAIAFTLDKVKVDPLQKLANLGADLGNAAVGYSRFNEVAKQFDMSRVSITTDQIDRLTTGTSKIKELTAQVSASADAFKKLDNTGLSKIKSGIEALNSSFKEFNDSFKNNFTPLLEAIRTETPAALLSDLNSKLDQLNTNMITLVSVQGEARVDIGKISGNTNKGITGRGIY